MHGIASGNWPLFRSFLESSITENARASSPQAYESALGWLAGTDSYERQPNDDPLFTQRFILAWFWYHTTKDGQEPWLSCNPAETDVAAPLKYRYDSRTRSKHESVFGRSEWFSSSRSCCKRTPQELRACLPAGRPRSRVISKNIFKKRYLFTVTQSVVF